MNSRGSEREAANLTDPDIAGIQPEGSLITSPKPTLSRRWFVLTLALAGCNQAAAASPYRAFLPRTDRNFGDGTPIPTPTPTRIPTPEPTATPDTRPCSPWPAELDVERRNLPTLEGVCFVRYTDRSQIPYPDIKELLTVDGSGNADWERRIVHILASDVVFQQRGIHLVGHEFFHLYQVRTVQDNGLQPPWQQAYFNTPEGRAFDSALGTVLTNTPNRQELVEYYPEWAKWLGEEYGRNRYEDAADLGSIWYNNPDWIRSNAWAPIRNFAATYWPKN